MRQTLRSFNEWGAVLFNLSVISSAVRFFSPRVKLAWIAFTSPASLTDQKSSSQGRLPIAVLALTSALAGIAGDRIGRNGGLLPRTGIAVVIQAGNNGLLAERQRDAKVLAVESVQAVLAACDRPVRVCAYQIASRDVLLKTEATARAMGFPTHIKRSMSAPTLLLIGPSPQGHKAVSLVARRMKREREGLLAARLPGDEWKRIRPVRLHENSRSSEHIALLSRASVCSVVTCCRALPDESSRLFAER